MAVRRPAIPADAAPQAGLYHLAWEVGTLAELEEIRRALATRGVLVGASDHRVSKSLYAKPHRAAGGHQAGRVRCGA